LASVNKVILLGNTGKDPEIRYLPSGMAIANVSIATSSRRKDKNTGETIEETQWHRLTFIDKLAEIVNQYVVKGQPIYIEGRLRYGKYTDKDGVERHTTDIVCDQMQMLGKKEDGGQRSEPRQAPRETPRDGNAQRAPRATPDRPPVGTAGSGFDDMDSDIPF
jgi:single-strand DNA-binding protein